MGVSEQLYTPAALTTRQISRVRIGISAPQRKFGIDGEQFLPRRRIEPRSYSPQPVILLAELSHPKREFRTWSMWRKTPRRKMYLYSSYVFEKSWFQIWAWMLISSFMLPLCLNFVDYFVRYVTSIWKMIMNGELRKMWKRIFVIYF
jgi:hypothetical protein